MGKQKALFRGLDSLVLLLYGGDGNYDYSCASVSICVEKVAAVVVAVVHR